MVYLIAGKLLILLLLHPLTRSTDVNYTTLYSFALQHNINVVLDFLEDTSSFSLLPQHIGYISTKSPVHLTDCAAFISTHSLLYSGCTLPKHCGPVNTTKLSQVWYGSELLFCHSTSLCPANSACKLSEQNHALYKLRYDGNLFLKNLTKFDYLNTTYTMSYTKNSLFSFPDEIYVMDNNSESCLISPYCVSISDWSSLDFTQQYSPHHATFSESWARACISYPDPASLHFVCAPFSCKFGDPLESRLIQLIFSVANFFIQPDLPGFPTSFISLQNIIPYTKNSSLTVTSAADPYNNITLLFPLPPVFVHDIYPNITFTEVCYDIHEHLSNPVSSAMSLLFDVEIAIITFLFNSLESEFTAIIGFVGRLLNKFITIIFDFLSKVPNIVPAFLTYCFFYFLQESHVKSLTYTGFLWLFFTFSQFDTLT